MILERLRRRKCGVPHQGLGLRRLMCQLERGHPCPHEREARNLERAAHAGGRGRPRSISAMHALQSIQVRVMMSL